MEKVVIVTISQPSLNPRVVKEATALQEAGFDVTVLYCHFINWAAKADVALLRKVKWKYKLVGGSPSEKKLLYFKTRLRFTLTRNLYSFLRYTNALADCAQARVYPELLKAAKKIKADWYIGHNLGALAVAVNAAKYNKAKAGFDFEDYHRGESGQTSIAGIKRIIYLENKYVPSLNYISAASPMIAEKIATHFPLQKEKIITLFNCFPLSQQPEFEEKDPQDKTLQLFWFSQTIGMNRGLEILIAAMLKIDDKDVHLTLAGRCNPDFKEYLDKHAFSLNDQIHFSGMIQPDEIPAYAAKFDVGMALELNIPENRNICLTNKVFTYLLAGNAIIFSETAMQLRFNKEYHAGENFNAGDVLGLVDVLRKYRNINMLNMQRKYNFELAKNDLNWANESEKLVKHISI